MIKKLMKQFLVVGIDSGIFWPSKEIHVSFCGYKILLRPATQDLAPTVVLEYESPMTMEDAILLVNRFLSSLSWIEGGKLRVTLITGGGMPINIGKGNANHINPYFRIDYLPDVKDPKAQLALALYREALNIESIPYKFLGFFKIINVIYKTGATQIDWINKVIENIEDHSASTRLSMLKSTYDDIGRYLYESGRCAVAHAFTDPIVDPDKPGDTRRLSDDLPIMQALAEYFIEHELGIPSQKTIWREHLYELEGFRALLESEIINKLKEKENVEIASIKIFPKLSIRLRDHDRIDAFEKMMPKIIGANDGRLLVRCVSSDQRVLMELFLNFAQERLEFDPFATVKVIDDGSVETINHMLDRISLCKGLLRNGQLEVWNSDEEILLGRCDPFIPVNIDISRTIANLEKSTEELRSKLNRRSTGCT